LPGIGPKKEGSSEEGGGKKKKLKKRVRMSGRDRSLKYKWERRGKVGRRN